MSYKWRRNKEKNTSGSRQVHSVGHGALSLNKNTKRLKAPMGPALPHSKCTWTNQGLKAGPHLGNKIKASQPTRPSQPVNRKPSITAKPMLNWSLQSFDVSQRPWRRGVRVTPCHFRLTIGKHTNACMATHKRSPLIFRQPHIKVRSDGCLISNVSAGLSPENVLGEFSWKGASDLLTLPSWTFLRIRRDHLFTPELV